jgi:predicted nucleic acid-binding protein
MPNFVLDTGIVLGYLLKANYAEEIQNTIKPFKSPNTAIICIVTKGEILSISKQRHWGDGKIHQLEGLLARLPTVDISDTRIIDTYAEIDAYSQGKLAGKPLPDGMTSRNMGCKNDLWIAAVTFVTKATLLTTDADFDHLNDVYFPVRRYKPNTR